MPKMGWVSTTHLFLSLEEIFLKLINCCNFLYCLESEAQGCGEGKDQRRRTMPCEIRPIAVDTPQTANLTPFFLGKGVLIEETIFFYNVSFIIEQRCQIASGRGVGADSGEKLEAEAANVPYLYLNVL